MLRNRSLNFDEIYIHTMLDYLLVMSLGFLGSFGHCIGMCGPITVAFSLAQHQAQSSLHSSHLQQPCDADLHDPVQRSPVQRPPDQSSASSGGEIWFHVLLNLGRVVSYALVGAGIGALGSVLVAGGQVAGLGSDLRRAIAMVTGLLLIWLGVVQLNPGVLPKLPLVAPMGQHSLHQRLNAAMMRLSMQRSLWTPFLLGLVWGLIPCGFLYVAQIKAAETADVWLGSMTMLAFGLGTVPTMLGLGLVSARLSADRRSQLFRLGGWMTVLIGVITLLRTGDHGVDYTGHGALVCLMLALVARPLSRIVKGLLSYRRALGVGAFVLSVAHLVHMVEHAWSWNMQAVFFMLPQHQWGVVMGVGAIALMTPLALTSADWAQSRLGFRWRSLHLLAVPALVLASAHCLLVGTHYLGRMQITWVNVTLIALLSVAVLGVLAVRSPWVWSRLSLEKFYVSPKQHR